MGSVGARAYDSQAAGVADGAGEFGVADPLHAALHYGYCILSDRVESCRRCVGAYLLSPAPW